MTERRAATIMTNVAAMAADRGPAIVHHNIPQDAPVLFSWVPGSTATADNINVISHTGGTPGRWIRQREDIQGDDFSATASVSFVTIAKGRFRVLPATSPMTTVDSKWWFYNTGAVAGDIITVARLGLGTKTVTVQDHDENVLAILAPDEPRWFAAYFDGDGWIPHSGGSFPPTA